MTATKRQMRLGVFVLGTGNHSAGWRYEGAAASGCSLPVMQQIASIAERGKFDLFFISDSLIIDPGDHPSFLNRFEPLTLLAALGMVTRHIGLGAAYTDSTMPAQRCGIISGWKSRPRTSMWANAACSEPPSCGRGTPLSRIASIPLPATYL